MMDKADFMDAVEQYASNDFICRFCDIDMVELERLIELDDWLMLVSDSYDHMPEEELILFEEELSHYHFHEYRD